MEPMLILCIQRNYKFVYWQVLFNEKGQMIFEGVESEREEDGSEGPLVYRHSLVVEPEEAKKAFIAMGIPENDPIALLTEVKLQCSGYGVMRNMERFLTNHCIYFLREFYHIPIDFDKIMRKRKQDEFQYNFR